MLSRSHPCQKKLKRLQARYEDESDNPIAPKRKVEETKLTQSQASPYNKDACFFCNEVAGYQKTLHSVTTTTAGQLIRDAVEISGNGKLRNKLSTAIDINGAHAIDVKYHNKCYVNNVTSVLRRLRSSHHQDNSDMAAKIVYRHNRVNLKRREAFKHGRIGRNIPEHPAKK